jgi:hypothetical protein
VRLQSASGVRFLSVEGIPTREALKERVKPGATVGEEVLGAYEVKGGRPVTVGHRSGSGGPEDGNPAARSQPGEPGENAAEGGRRGRNP